MFREERAIASAFPFWTLFDKTRVPETIHAKQRANVIPPAQCRHFDADASQWRQLNARTSINVRGPRRTHKQTFAFNWRIAWLTNGRPSEFRSVSMPNHPTGSRSWSSCRGIGKDGGEKRRGKKSFSLARVHPGEQRATRCWINRTGIARCCMRLR